MTDMGTATAPTAGTTSRDRGMLLGVTGRGRDTHPLHRAQPQHHFPAAQGPKAALLTEF